MIKRPYEGPKSKIFDCWHIAMHLQNSNARKEVGDGILDTWQKAHNWRTQLQEQKETIRKRNLLARCLRDEKAQLSESAVYLSVQLKKAAREIRQLRAELELEKHYNEIKK